MIADLDAHIRQMRGVGRIEGGKLIRGVLGGAVAPQQHPMEIEAHLMDLAGGGDGHGVDEIVPAVAAQLAQGNLCAGEHHRL